MLYMKRRDPILEMCCPIHILTVFIPHGSANSWSDSSCFTTVCRDSIVCILCLVSNVICACLTVATLRRPAVDGHLKLSMATRTRRTQNEEEDAAALKLGSGVLINTARYTILVSN
jgi:hypothetical protein